MMTGNNSLRVLNLPTSPSKQALATHLFILPRTPLSVAGWLFPVLLLQMSLLKNLQLGFAPSLTKQRNTYRLRKTAKPSTQTKAGEHTHSNQGTRF